ncbi:hypothetical protein SK128_000222, partial [Halocaridina rubra]
MSMEADPTFNLFSNHNLSCTGVEVPSERTWLAKEKETEVEVRGGGVEASGSGGVEASAGRSADRLDETG